MILHMIMQAEVGVAEEVVIGEGGEEEAQPPILIRIIITIIPHLHHTDRLILILCLQLYHQHSKRSLNGL